MVIDEAAQALEVSCYIPILLSKQVILGGDHKQLPPTIKSREAEQKGLSITLFDRMMSKVAKKQHYSQLLRTQYRMNEKIMNWSSKEVYNGLLLAAENVKERCLEKDFPILMLMDTFGCGMGETTLKDEVKFCIQKRIYLSVKVSNKDYKEKLKYQTTINYYSGQSQTIFPLQIQHR